MSTETKSWSTGKILTVAAVLAAIIGSSTGFATASFSRPSPTAQSREFYVLTSTANFNDTLLKETFNKTIPHDIFIPDRIAVNKGDSVLIHFYNTEDEQEPHTFTMGAPFNIDKDQPMQTRTDITFTASSPGLFRYYCRYHEPTMEGLLIVQA